MPNVDWYQARTPIQKISQRDRQGFQRQVFVLGQLRCAFPFFWLAIAPMSDAEAQRGGVRPIGWLGVRFGLSGILVLIYQLGRSFDMSTHVAH